MKKYFLFFACCFFAMPAFAHVTANPDAGPAGGDFETAFRIGHGCNGSPTKAVTVELPEGVILVKAMDKTGWTVNVEKNKAEWRGGPLPDHQKEDFRLTVRLPQEKQVLYFPVLQTCETGENHWDQIPAKGQHWHDLKFPAPFVNVGMKPSPETGHHH